MAYDLIAVSISPSASAHRLVLVLERLDQGPLDPEVDRDREQDRVLLLVVVPELVAQVAPGAAEVGRASSVAVGDLDPGPRRVGPGLAAPRRGSPCSSSPWPSGEARPTRRREVRLDRRTPLRWWSATMRYPLGTAGSVSAMADRPRGNGGPEEGTPEYNWLYGNKGAGSAPGGQDATRAVPQQPRPDETQVMPASPAGGDDHPAPGPHQPPDAAPGRAAARAPAAGRAGGVSGSPLPAALGLAAAPAVGRLPGRRPALCVDQGREGRVRAQGRPARRPAGHDVPDGRQRLPRRAHQGGAQGARHRQRRRPAHRHDHAAAHRRRAQPADVDPARLPGRGPGHGTTKINAAYAYGGPEAAGEDHRAETGIRIDEYVEVGLGGVVDMVDAVGGIEICPTQRMKDKLANLDIKKGCQEADGKTALAYARSRHTSDHRRHRPAPGTSARSSRPSATR